MTDKTILIRQLCLELKTKINDNHPQDSTARYDRLLYQQLYNINKFLKKLNLEEDIEIEEFILGSENKIELKYDEITKGRMKSVFKSISERMELVDSYQKKNKNKKLNTELLKLYNFLRSADENTFLKKKKLLSFYLKVKNNHQKVKHNHQRVKKQKNSQKKHKIRMY